MLVMSKIILIYFRLSVDFSVVFLVSRNDGETGGVCDSKCGTNQMYNAHYSFIYLNKILYYGRVRGSLMSFKHENWKIESLLRIWKINFLKKWCFIVTNYQLLPLQKSSNFLARVQEVVFKHNMSSICFNYHWLEIENFWMFNVFPISNKSLKLMFKCRIMIQFLF